MFEMKAIYPGSFDPVTAGHLDIIERSARIFDHVVVSVAVNIEKKPMFTVAERVKMLKNACQHLDNVEVDYFHGLLVNYVVSREARVVVKGLRAVSDFEFEFVAFMFSASSASHLPAFRASAPCPDFLGRF